MEGTHTTAVTFRRVRDRLNKAGLQLELRAEPDGFQWDIVDKPLQTRRVFPTVQAALEHADIYTRVWYQESTNPAGGDRLVRSRPRSLRPHRRGQRRAVPVT